MPVTRIIAGSRRGRRLRTPPHSATRPTSDRVREAAFSLIADWAGTGGEASDHMLSGLSFLDLYAGTGAIALEAASRGAGPVWAIESDQATARLARGNARDTDLPVQVQAARVERTVAGPAPLAFDVVWADPPYALPAERLAEVLAALLRSGWLAAEGLLVLERSWRDSPPQWPSGMTEPRLRRYGETVLYLACAGKGESC